MEIGGINLLMSPEDDDLLLIHVKEFLYMDDLSFYILCKLCAFVGVCG